MPTLLGLGPVPEQEPTVAEQLNPQAIIDMVALLAETVWHLMDNTEESSGPDGVSVFTVTVADFDSVSKVLEQIEDLPIARAGLILGPSSKIRIALNDMIVNRTTFSQRD